MAGALSVTESATFTLKSLFGCAGPHHRRTTRAPLPRPVGLTFVEAAGCAPGWCVGARHADRADARLRRERPGLGAAGCAGERRPLRHGRLGLHRPGRRLNDRRRCDPATGPDRGAVPGPAGAGGRCGRRRCRVGRVGRGGRRHVPRRRPPGDRCRVGRPARPGRAAGWMISPGSAAAPQGPGARREPGRSPARSRARTARSVGRPARESAVDRPAGNGPPPARHLVQGSCR